MVNALEAAGCGPKQSAGGFSARCPAHDDSRPSLSVKDGDKGGVVVKCHRDCTLEEILGALNLPRDAVRRPRTEREEPLDIYPYTDEDGNLLYEVLRYPGHKFLQRRPDGRGDGSGSSVTSAAPCTAFLVCSGPSRHARRSS